MIRKRAHSELRSFHRSERLEAFSDGVFAIVVTLLVLELSIGELHDPSGKDVIDAVAGIKNKLLAHAFGFLFVGQMWWSHVNFFRMIVRIDSVVFWLNILLLMLISLVPFPIMLIGDYPGNHGAVLVFGLLFVCVSVAWTTQSIYCMSKGLMSPHVDKGALRIGTRIATILFVLAPVPMLFVRTYPVVALFWYAGITLGYILMQRFFRLQPGNQGDTEE
jgi:uncharacterized membrane protein